MRRATAARVTAVGAIAAALSTSASARAHFILQSPPSWMSQDAVGSPEKLGPCGDEDDGLLDSGVATPTGIVTAFHPGDTVTISIDEAIFHPGHYRIALSVDDRSELPAEPVVTTGASTPCGTAAIESPVMFPVLADDVFDHTAPFSAPQTVQITLPTNVACTKCTLQIIEFMSDHPLNDPGGCFYHHCADISIQPADAGGGDGGPEPDAGSTKKAGGGSSSSGCSCDAPGGGGALSSVGPAGLLLGPVLFLARRGRRTRA